MNRLLLLCLALALPAAADPLVALHAPDADRAAAARALVPFGLETE